MGRRFESYRAGQFHSRRGENGKHNRLKICRFKLAGSSPVADTNKGGYYVKLFSQRRITNNTKGDTKQ